MILNRLAEEALDDIIQIRALIMKLIHLSVNNSMGAKNAIISKLIRENKIGPHKPFTELLHCNITDTERLMTAITIETIEQKTKEFIFCLLPKSVSSKELRTRIFSILELMAYSGKSQKELKSTATKIIENKKFVPKDDIEDALYILVKGKAS